jgi:hypothetical protein
MRQFCWSLDAVLTADNLTNIADNLTVIDQNAPILVLPRRLSAVLLVPLSVAGSVVRI